MKKIYTFVLFVLLSISLEAQPLLPMHQDWQIALQRAMLSHEELHSSFMPYVQSRLDAHFSPDSVLRFNRSGQPSSYLHRKTRHEHFLEIEGDGFSIHADPLFDLWVGQERDSAVSTYNNTRGAQMFGSIGPKVRFQTSFFENQGRYQPYVNRFADSTRMVPGLAHSREFGESGFDFSRAEGSVVLEPSRFFNLTLGHGKNFIGNGYRSLLLSDAASSYPYVRVMTNVWKLQYVNIFSIFTNAHVPYQNLYISGYNRKHGSFHYLSYKPFDGLELGLFEAVVWQNSDSTSFRPFDLNYLNPIIFYRPVEYSLGSPDNVMMGANFSWNLMKRFQLYGQLMLDDFYFARAKEGAGYIDNKYGYQLGIKYFDVLGIPNFYLQAEYNRVRPYTYGHQEPGQNYAHFWQSLAHPLGANFTEWVGVASYRRGDFLLKARLNLAEQGQDSLGSHWGSDVFRSEWDSEYGWRSFGNLHLQGVSTRIAQVDASLSYILNPSTNAMFSLGFQRRTLDSDWVNERSTHVYFAFRTSLWNLYSDF